MRFSFLPRLTRWILVLCIFFVLCLFLARVGFYLYFKPSDLQEPNLFSVFWMGFRYDFRDVAVIGFLLLILGSFKIFHPFNSRFGKRFWQTVWFIAILAAVIFYTIDFAHFAYLGQRLNASSMELLQNTKTSLGMVWETYPVIRILIVMAIIVAALFWVVRRTYKVIAHSNAVNIKSVRITSFIVLFFVLALGIFGQLDQYPLRWSNAFTLGSDFNAQVALNPFQSFFSSLAFRNVSFDLAKTKKYYPLMARYLGVKKPDSATLNYSRSFSKSDSGLNTHPNIVLVICESFSAYKSSLYGNPLNATPFFKKLITQSAFFDHCFTPHVATARGVWDVVTGIPDVAMKKTISRDPLAVDQRTIINCFKGYKKYYFIGGSTSWANVRGVLKNNIAGLRIYEKKDFPDPGLDVWGISDKNLFLEANKIFTTQTQPFFAIIQTSDNHRPYSIPKEDLSEFHIINYPLDTLKQYGFFANNEFNAFRYFDFCVKKFITAAQKEPYFKNTIFMFVGDHGINGDAHDMFPKAWTDQGLTREHVPLIFYAPALIKPQRHSFICSQSDVLPTLAGLANIDYTNTTLGKDLFHDKDTASRMAFIIEQFIRQTGVVKGDYYFKQQMNNGPTVLVSIRNNQPVPVNAHTDSIKNDMQQWMNAFLYTAQYMLFNNKKEKAL